ncbi:MAG: hypothetical protein ACI81O_000981 [Cyclobacteriaceae bacterium]|jgi:hypothetical protein
MLETEIVHSRPPQPRLPKGLHAPRRFSRWGCPVRRAVIVLLACLSYPAAAELYKYTNEDGVTVLDSHVPARYIKDGYTILSLRGRVLEVVPRALSNQEILDRDRERAVSEEKDRLERERLIADQNLMRVYGTPADVVRARDTKLASIEGFIEIIKGNLQNLQSQKRNFEAELADVERRGGVISPARIDQMRGIEDRILQAMNEIAVKEQELSDLSAAYSADLIRVTELYRKKPRDG